MDHKRLPESPERDTRELELSEGTLAQVLGSREG